MASKDNWQGAAINAFLILFFVALAGVAFLAFTASEAASGFGVTKSVQGFWSDLTDAVTNAFGGGKSNSSNNNVDPTVAELAGKVANDDPTLDLDKASQIVNQYYAQDAGISEDEFNAFTQGGNQ